MSNTNSPSLGKTLLYFVCGLVMVLGYQNCAPINSVESEGSASVGGEPGAGGDSGSLSQGEEEVGGGEGSEGEVVLNPIDPPPVNCKQKQPYAFPGALGFGRSTKGGRGGRIVHVTNLKNSGTGSLRWALEDIDEPRIVVFDIEGRIHLRDEISVRNPYVTIAGQTAPGQGIVVSGSRIHLRTKEVIVRGLKSRPGDESGGDIGRARDTISIGGNGIKGVEQIIVDHNSLTWAVDETLTIWGSSKNITLSHNLVAEALYDSIHVDEGKTDTAPHGMGIFIGHKPGEADSENISIVRNLLASNNGRNPSFKGVKGVEFKNNYITNYGWGHQGISLGGDSGPVKGDFIGNYYEEGKDTSHSEGRPAFDLRGLNNGSSVYFSQNVVEGHGDADDSVSKKAHGKLGDISKSPNVLSLVETLPITDVRDYTVKNSGAKDRQGQLDPVDSRIIASVISGKTRIIDSQDEVGGYKVYNFQNSKIVDSDRDGLPDDFERANASLGFDPNRADDKADFDNDGYSNIEEYINGLIDGFDLESCD